jgi:probable HAF family extracellular repeat protein
MPDRWWGHLTWLKVISMPSSPINDAGQVVGVSYTAAGGHAFITGPDAVGMTDLNSLVHLPGGLVMTQAVAINNSGQVLVSAEILPVIPETESYALMLVGLVLTGVMVRHKQKADALEGVSYRA